MFSAIRSFAPDIIETGVYTSAWHPVLATKAPFASHVHHVRFRMLSAIRSFASDVIETRLNTTRLPVLATKARFIFTNSRHCYLSETSPFFGIISHLSLYLVVFVGRHRICRIIFKLPTVASTWIHVCIASSSLYKLYKHPQCVHRNTEINWCIKGKSGT